VGPVRSNPRSWLQAGLYAAPIIVLAGAAWAHRNIGDDGFIYLRIVHQVTGGHGPVFNIGQRVEAYTGPLWLAVLSIADLVTPVRLEWLAVVLGIASTLAGLTLAMLGSARLARRDDPDALLVPFGALVVVSLLPMWFYASSGLETGLTFLWLGACLWILAEWSTTDHRLSPIRAVVLGIGWLVRPELMLYSIAFLITVIVVQWRSDTWTSRIRIALVAFALPIAYQVFRMGYFGELVANTAIAKEGTRVRWTRGWRYFRDFVDAYWFAIPVVLLLAGGYVPLGIALRGRDHKRAALVIAAFFVAASANALYIVAVGGDYEHARLLLPPVFAVCAPIAVVPATRRYVVALALGPWAIAAAFVLRPPARTVGTGFALPRAGKVTTDDLGWGAKNQSLQLLSRPGVYLQTGGAQGYTFFAANLRAAPTIRLPAAESAAVGVSSYAAGNDLYVFDVLGLADPLTAHLRTPLLTASLPYPGHEKLLPRPWIAARLFAPGVTVDPKILPSGSYFALIPPVTGTAFAQQIEWARAVQQCPAIRRLNRSVSAPLTVGRFFHNIVDAFTNNSLRIPPDPETAYKQLCGTTASPTAVHAAAAVARTAAPSADVRITVGSAARARVRRELSALLRPSRPARITSGSGFV
jgi:arabinofuranosyltransferase